MRKRLVLVYSMVALIVVILAFVLASLTVQDRVINYFQTMQTDNLSSYTQLLEDYYAKEQSWQGIERVFSNLFEGFDPMDLDYLNPYGLLLIDLNKKVLFSSNNGEIGENAPEDFKQFAAHLEYNGKTVAYLVSKRFLQYLPDDINRDIFLKITRTVILSTLIALSVGYLFSLRLATTVTGQVSEIEQITKMIKQGHYTSRVSIPKYPTLKEVSIAINAMAETLEEQEDLRRRMTADIAHDLRTPLSIQQAVIEAIDDGIYPFDQSSLDALKTQNKYLIRLVEDLRTLALADANALNLKKGPLNLLELSKDVLEGYKSMMSKMNIRASVKSQAADLDVVADRDRVIQILHNLLDNALYYSPENTEICIDSVSNGNYTEIKISDQGPGIQVEPIDRVFDRYYSGKLDSNGFSAGSGLGLYISREIARAHDGYLLAENKADGGAIFRLGLPISDQQSSKDYMAKCDKNR